MNLVTQQGTGRARWPNLTPIPGHSIWLFRCISAQSTAAKSFCETSIVRSRWSRPALGSSPADKKVPLVCDHGKGTRVALPVTKTWALHPLPESSAFRDKNGSVLNTLLVGPSTPGIVKSFSELLSISEAFFDSFLSKYSKDFKKSQCSNYGFKEVIVAFIKD